jgi:hypothetical protein
MQNYYFRNLVTLSFPCLSQYQLVIMDVLIIIVAVCRDRIVELVSKTRLKYISDHKSYRYSYCVRYS